MKLTDRVVSRSFASVDPRSYIGRDQCFKGAGMVQRRQRERSLFEVLLPDGHKLWPDWLRKIDLLLEDDAVIDVVAQALEARWPQSRRRGRLGTPAEVVMRLLILKHLFDWSYDDQVGRIRNRLRSVTRRVLIIGYEARSPKTRAAMVKSYRTLMATTRAVLRDAATMVRRLGQRLRTASPQVQPILQRAQHQLQAMRPRVQRVGGQTGARILGGDTHVPDKVLSVFEPHTETIRKGKIAKPTEFGNLVTIQEAEHQIITAYEVHSRRPADVTLWTPALDRHQTIFGRAPDLAAGDRGFASAGNEKAATDRGVRRVILPRRGPKSPARRAYERQRWFRRGQRWRVGCEGRISVLKRRHGLDRCRYHGEDGMHRWVGLGVIANNLVSAATFSKARAAAWRKRRNATTG